MYYRDRMLLLLGGAPLACLALPCISCYYTSVSTSGPGSRRITLSVYTSVPSRPGRGGVWRQHPAGDAQRTCRQTAPRRTQRFRQLVRLRRLSLLASKLDKFRVTLDTYRRNNISSSSIHRKIAKRCTEWRKMTCTLSTY